MTIDEQRIRTLEHIRKVQILFFVVSEHMLRRALDHDASKLQEPELSGFAQLPSRKNEAEYGTETYTKMLEQAREVVSHHYKENDHHPEHFENGIEGMSLLSVLEMFIDWSVASSETKNGSIERSLTENVKRFGIEKQLASILWNTAWELEWIPRG
jgi:hypothetical protein